MEDITFNKLQELALSDLKFEDIKKIRNNEANFKQYSTERLFYWCINRINNLVVNDGWHDPIADKKTNTNDLHKYIRQKIIEIDYWVMNEYKNETYMKDYNKNYYENVTLPKLRESGVKSRAEYLKDIETKYFNIVLNAHKTLLENGKKGTAKNIAELTKIDIKTSQKYNRKVKEYLAKN